MHPILRNILAVIIGLVIGSIINMAIIMISGPIIPPPANVDTTNMEGLKSSMHLFQPKHFLFPFLAHALGTFAGAWLAAFIAVSHHLKLALIVGVFFLVGGIINVVMLPSPLWFTITDIAFAYIPMAFLGAKLSKK